MRLVCDRCGRTYQDQRELDIVQRSSGEWRESCAKLGIEPRGLAPCPNFFCEGEMVLRLLESDLTS